MSHDPHWIIKKTHEGDGNSSDHIDPETFRTHQSAKFVLYNARERANCLEQLAAAIGSDDSTLRSRAELLELHREMSRTHRQLLALKR
jgi:hypothetical protein